MSSKWRTSASLILVANNNNNAEPYDYNCLMLKRSDKTAIASNQTVFPGGLLDKSADENIAWLQYFEEFGVSQESLRRLVLVSEHRPSILAAQGTGCYDRFFKRSQIWAREITLRLTALRECFEEVGILLCRTRDQLHNAAGIGHCQVNFARDEWQQRVHQQPSEFLTLCRQLQVLPDLWALHEWSAWASPAYAKKGNETVFFMAFVDRQPSLLAEPSEVKECLWLTPPELLHLSARQELWFMPPQIYELSRLLGITKYQRLLEFAHKRSQLGTTLFMPISYMCTDTVVNVYPGDDFYLPEPHLVTDLISFDGTAAEFRLRAQKLHRSEHFNTSAANLILNFDAPNGHLPPLHLSDKRHKL